MQTTHQIDLPALQIESQDFPKLPLRPPARVPHGATRRRRVVITGIGVVAPSGIGTEALWEHLITGRSAVRMIEGFDVSAHPVKIAAQVPSFNARHFLGPAKARGLGRFCHLSMAATRLAVRDARPPEGMLATPRTGLYLGTSAGAIQVGEDQAEIFHERGPAGVRPTFAFAISPHSAATQSASEFGICGPIETICSDCPSGLDAVATAYRRIASGALDCALAGGADAPITPMLLAGFGRAGVLATGTAAPESASRPFDRKRSGFVLAEAGVMLVLEEAELAAARGARIYGEILGAGTGRDRPTYIGDGDPSGQGYLAAAELAMQESSLDPVEIGVVNAHAPGVPRTDLAEIRALRALFGAAGRDVAVTSIKGGLGQPLAASGVLQLASTLLTFEHGWIPPTINCEELDPECDLDIVRGNPRRLTARHALVMSHGIGGNTTALVVRSPCT
jgi:3-oxoacyl-[acyl-carrier-protein] synthase II